MNAKYTEAQVKEIYRSYCFAIAARTGLKGNELSEAIRKSVKLSYKVVFGNDIIRQKDMTHEQLQLITEHRENVISIILPTP